MLLCFKAHASSRCYLAVLEAIESDLALVADQDLNQVLSLNWKKIKLKKLAVKFPGDPLSTMAFPNTNPADIQMLRATLKEAGGDLREAFDSPMDLNYLSTAHTHFRVTEAGDPYILLNRRMDLNDPTSKETIAHEYEHFLLWKEVRNRLIEALPAHKRTSQNKKKANLIAWELIVTDPVANLYSEARAVRIELIRRLKSYRQEIDFSETEKEVNNAIARFTPHTSVVPEFKKLLQVAFSRATYPYYAGLNSGFQSAAHIYWEIKKTAKRISVLEKKTKVLGFIPILFRQKLVRIKRAKLEKLKAEQTNIQQTLTQIMKDYVAVASNTKAKISQLLTKYASDTGGDSTIRKHYLSLAREIDHPYSPSHLLSDEVINEGLNILKEYGSALSQDDSLLRTYSTGMRRFDLYHSIKDGQTPGSELFDFSKIYEPL